MTFIDRKSRRLVNIQTLVQVQDTSGDYGTGTYTTSHAVIVDIQPISGGATTTPSGQTVNASHRMFTEQRYSDIAINNKVVDGSNSYLIVYVSDLRTHYEYLLKEL